MRLDSVGPQNQKEDEPKLVSTQPEKLSNVQYREWGGDSICSFVLLLGKCICEASLQHKHGVKEEDGPHPDLVSFTVLCVGLLFSPTLERLPSEPDSLPAFADFVPSLPPPWFNLDLDFFLFQ